MQKSNFFFPMHMRETQKFIVEKIAEYLLKFFLLMTLSTIPYLNTLLF